MVQYFGGRSAIFFCMFFFKFLIGVVQRKASYALTSLAAYGSDSVYGV